MSHDRQGETSIPLPIMTHRLSHRPSVPPESLSSVMPWTIHENPLSKVPSPALSEETLDLLRSVPEWFGRPESNREYAEAAGRLPSWCVRSESGQLLGLTVVEQHFQHAWEIHLMAVRASWHRRGIGRAMLSALERRAAAADVRLLQVKTLGASHPDPSYRETRRFYEAVGFLPLEETDLWGEDTPCLILVKPL